MAKEEFAFISDVHSNLEALKAVLDDVGGMNLFCLGDTIGYGASPNEVIDLLRQKQTTMIIGNHDNAALQASPFAFNHKAAVAIVWNSRQLTQENRQFLQSLPRNRKLLLAEVPVYMTHGSPDDNLAEYVYPVTHSDMFDFYLKKLGVKVIALGHTHLPFEVSDREGTVFNPGSVGQPRDGDPRASYAVLSIDQGKVTLEHRRKEYDIETSAKKIVEAGLPRSLGERLFKGE
jgi:putative phosphoesterase